MRKHILAAAVFFAAAGPAFAHTTYLLPNAFWPANQRVDIEGAFATSFFTPAIALPADLTIIMPGGARVPPEQMEITATATHLSKSLPRVGTYRITTGEKLGPVTTLVSDGAGGWRPLGQGETPAADAQTTTLQTVTVADAYITRGAATRDVVDTPIGRLALHPVTHPDQIVAGQGFDVELLFDGQPFPNMPVVLYGRGDPDSKLDKFFVTGADGRAHITFDQPGQYVIAVRHRANAAPGSAAAVQSFTTALTLEAFAEMPRDTEQVPAATPVRRHRSGY